MEENILYLLKKMKLLIIPTQQENKKKYMQLKYYVIRLKLFKLSHSYLNQIHFILFIYKCIQIVQYLSMSW